MKTQTKRESVAVQPVKLWHSTHNWLGRFTDPHLSRFRGLQETLPKAGLMVDPAAYLSLMTFAAGTTFIVTLTLGLFAVFFFGQVVVSPADSSIGFLDVSTLAPAIPVLSILFSLIVFMVLLKYPNFKASSRAYSVETELFHLANYMNILSSVGLPPARIFRQVANQFMFRHLRRDMALIVRDMDLLGIDFITALKNAEKRSPSKQLSDLFEGIVSTIYSGGDLASYFTVRAKDLAGVRRDFVRRFQNRLAFLSEAVMAVLVVLPLMVIILFATTSAMPFGVAADPLTITIFIYLLLPLMSIVFLVLINTSTPKD
ncbi:MAG: type II secretion system F family protein [Candidatus Bathyarchaeia archaeon]